VFVHKLYLKIKKEDQRLDGNPKNQGSVKEYPNKKSRLLGREM